MPTWAVHERRHEEHKVIAQIVIVMPAREVGE
jgi:hypothetical protein